MAPLSFATLSPDGSRVAALASEFSAGSASALLVIDVRTGRAVEHSLPGEPDGPPLVWVGSSRIAVLVRDALDRVGVDLIDPGSGVVERITTAVQALALSADGSVAVLQTREDAVLRIGAAASWLAGGSAPDATSLESGGRLAGQVMLDAAGRRLAVVWLAASGADAEIAVYCRSDGGWSLVRSDPLREGVSAALVVWVGSSAGCSGRGLRPGRAAAPSRRSRPGLLREASRP